MRINAKKLASLASAGAGALALTAGKAEADSIIVYSNPLNVTVGFGEGNDAWHFFDTFSGAGGPSFLVRTSSSQGGAHLTRRLYATGGPVALFGFALTADVNFRLQTFSAGAVWPTDLGGGGGQRLVASRSWGLGRTNIQAAATQAFTDKYLLFEFTTNDLTQYGWIEASLQLANENSSDPAAGPNLTIIGYAYDASGALLPAGDTGQTSPSPEPSSLAEGGIAALLLGAEGFRRWRKARSVVTARSGNPPLEQ